MSALALSLVPECDKTVARGSKALAAGGRWDVVDLSVPANAPRWTAQGYLAINRPFAANGDWLARHPWKSIRDAMPAHLTDFSSTDTCSSATCSWPPGPVSQTIADRLTTGEPPGGGCG